MLQLSDLTLEDIFLKITMGEELGKDSEKAKNESKPRPVINLVTEDEIAENSADDGDEDKKEDDE